MKFISVLFFYCSVFTGFSQNDAVKCIKTSWPIIGGYQIDSYNEDNKRLSFIQVNGNGDTTQYWRSIYDSRGFLLRYYTIIEKYNPFDYRFVKDSINNLDLRISIKKNGNDTIVITNDTEPLNEFGDPIYDSRYGNMQYTYNSKKLKVKEICIDDSGDTTGIGYYEYDQFDNQTSFKWFEKNILTFSIESEFDANQNLIHTIQKNGLEKLYEEFNLYDANNFLYKSYGTDYHMKEPEIWEMTFEIIPCN